MIARAAGSGSLVVVSVPVEDPARPGALDRTAGDYLVVTRGAALPAR